MRFLTLCVVVMVSFYVLSSQAVDARPLPGRCFGHRATIQGAGTIVGTSGDDVITGSSGNDQISGGGGNDFICGLDGDDIIDTDDSGAQPGSVVWVDGGAGNDTVGGSGNGSENHLLVETGMTLFTLDFTMVSPEPRRFPAVLGTTS